MQTLGLVKEKQIRVEVFIPHSVFVLAVEELFRCHARIKIGGKPTALESIAALTLGSITYEDVNNLG